MNTISSYLGEDFDLVEAVTDRKIPLPHRIAIRRELEKVRSFPYDHLLPPQKTIKSLGLLYDGTPLYALRPHCPGKTQYRFSLVSPIRYGFLVLDFFHRKDANFEKQIAIAENRYKRIQSNQATYELIDLNKLSL